MHVVGWLVVVGRDYSHDAKVKAASKARHGLMINGKTTASWAIAKPMLLGKIASWGKVTYW